MQELTNFGKPLIVVRDGDFNGNRELLLRHKFDGRDLDMGYGIDVMKAIHKMWDRAVHLETYIDGKWRRFTWNGEEQSHVTIDKDGNIVEDDDDDDDEEDDYMPDVV